MWYTLLAMASHPQAPTTKALACWTLSGKGKESTYLPVNSCNQHYKTGICSLTLYHSRYIKSTLYLKLYYKYIYIDFFNVETRYYLLVVCHINILFVSKLHGYSPFSAHLTDVSRGDCASRVQLLLLFFFFFHVRSQWVLGMILAIMCEKKLVFYSYWF